MVDRGFFSLKKWGYKESGAVLTLFSFFCEGKRVFFSMIF